MATHSFHALHHTVLKLHPSLSDPPLPTHHHSATFLKPTSSFPPPLHSSSSTTTATFSIFPTTSSSSSSTASSSSETTASYDLLRHHLSTRNFREADEVTRRLLILLAGEPALKRGYVFFSEVKFIAETDLEKIDDLWTQHSDGKFGYSVQKRLWEKCGRDFTRFFIKVGWMKKLDTEVEQYNYR